MENKTLAKLYVQTEKDGNYEKSAQYREQILAIEGFSEEVDGVIINHEKIYVDVFDNKVNLITYETQSKKPNKDSINRNIDELNVLFKKFTDETKKNTL